MRIISGNKKGIIIRAPNNLPVRPTTDRAKESLFNILENKYYFNELEVLDLFSGTGNIAYEFASRGAKHVTAVDKHEGCIKFIKATAAKLGLNQIKPIKADAFTFLEKNNNPFNIIFSDAPYALEQIRLLPSLVKSSNSLLPNGLLIIEHATGVDFSAEPTFESARKYGQSTFSFFTNNIN